MIDLKLNDKEKTVLNDTLTECLSRLHDEIAHTDAAEYRDMLKKRQEILVKIQGRLN